MRSESRNDHGEGGRVAVNLMLGAILAARKDAMTQSQVRIEEKRAQMFIGLVLSGLVTVVTVFAAESVIVPVSQNNVQRIEITADSYSFTPDRLVAKVNIPVELVFKSASWIVPHNFVLIISQLREES